MAEVVSVEKAETVYTIKLTESELATLVAGLGLTSVTQRSLSSIARKHKLLERPESTQLYRHLAETVLGVDI